MSAPSSKRRTPCAPIQNLLGVHPGMSGGTDMLIFSKLAFTLKQYYVPKKCLLL